MWYSWDSPLSRTFPKSITEMCGIRMDFLRDMRKMCPAEPKKISLSP